jgi:hypothetical protein
MRSPFNAANGKNLAIRPIYKTPLENGRLRQGMFRARRKKARKKGTGIKLRLKNPRWD